MTTQADIDRLERALSRGVKRVTFSDGRTVEFNSFEEITKRITYLRQSLSQQSVDRKIKVKYTKGIQA
jgi:ribosome modulation factor